MQAKPQGAFLREEKRHMDRVYQHLDAMSANAREDMVNRRQYVRSGAFEDQDAFTAHSELQGRVTAAREALDSISSQLECDMKWLGEKARAGGRKITNRASAHGNGPRQIFSVQNRKHDL